MKQEASAPAKYRRYSSEQRRALLIEAALVCLARGGAVEFTIDKICAEAGVSRGLITHHFESKEGLLAAVYIAMYERMVAVVLPPEVKVPEIVAMTNALFKHEVSGHENVNIWLTLWGEIANNTSLRSVHRKMYRPFRKTVAGAIQRIAEARKRDVDPEWLAMMFLCIIDGLWLEQVIDPGSLSIKAARDACFKLLEAFLGPLERHAMAK